MSTTLPPGFPVLTLQTMRALCALELLDPSKLPIALDALYHALWVERQSQVGKTEGFAPILEKVLGKELAGRVLEGMNGKEAKARLMGNTDVAFNGGAFGLPWWECTDGEGKQESFWGFDHFGQVVDFLGVGRGAGDGGMRAML
jgi:2-hydroxychromene-2-carboxylate isomerase